MVRLILLELNPTRQIIKHTKNTAPGTIPNASGLFFSVVVVVGGVGVKIIVVVLFWSGVDAKKRIMRIKIGVSYNGIQYETM